MIFIVCLGYKGIFDQRIFPELFLAHVDVTIDIKKQ